MRTLRFHAYHADLQTSDIVGCFKGEFPVNVRHRAFPRAGNHHAGTRQRIIIFVHNRSLNADVLFVIRFLHGHDDHHVVLYPVGQVRAFQQSIQNFCQRTVLDVESLSPGMFHLFMVEKELVAAFFT